MLRSDRGKRPGNYPGSQETILGWTLPGRTPATTTEHDTQDTFLFSVEESLEKNLNRFWKVEIVEQCTMPKEQLVGEQHFIIHRNTSNKIEDLL